MLQIITLVIITYQYIDVHLNDHDYDNDKIVKIVSESCLLLLFVLQDLVFYKFMFRFQKVEIELKAFYE